jgi:predicted transcriptional regulator
MKAELGPLEMQVLGLLDSARTASVAAVRAELATRGKRYAYTTVMTVLARLYDKGLLSRDKVGLRYEYRSGPRASQFKQRLIQRVQAALFSDRQKSLATLLDGNLTREQLKELRRLIDERLARR